MKAIITLALLLSQLAAFSQIAPTNPYEKIINKLFTAKHEYEKFDQWNLNGSKDSSYRIYLQHIEVIKSNNELYKEYINSSLKKPEFGKKLVFYSYVRKDLPFDRNLYTISQRDLYRVIYHYLLVQDDKILPPTLADIKISIKKDYNKPFKLQQEEDYFPGAANKQNAKE